jgi:hypothetical protein
MNMLSTPRALPAPLGTYHLIRIMQHGWSRGKRSRRTGTGPRIARARQRTLSCTMRSASSPPPSRRCSLADPDRLPGAVSGDEMRRNGRPWGTHER